jgi:AcrR family transcriptional regulator
MPRIAASQREALTQSRRNQIVDAAIRRWLEDGFDATTVASIAREAGLAKGTVYLYFPTKEEILSEAINRYSLLPDMRAFAAQITDTPIADTVPLLVRALWAALRARVDVIRFFAREITVRPEHARHFLETVVLPTNKLVAEHLLGEVEAGVLRDMDMFIAARSLVGMLMIFLFSQHVFGGQELHPLEDEAIVQTISDLFLHGILSQPEGG